MKYLALVMAMVLPLAACMKYKPRLPEEPRGKPRYLTLHEQRVIARDISMSLKDPFSPIFYFLMVNTPPDGKNGFTTYCGDVNAKNSFNGYNGRTPFMAIVNFSNGVVVSAVLTNMAVPGTLREQAINMMCQEAGFYTVDARMMGFIMPPVTPDVLGYPRE